MIPVPSLQAASPQQIVTRETGANLLGWGLFALTTGALIYGILNSRLQLRKAKEENLKMKELEHNLKEILGDKYQKI